MSLNAMGRLEVVFQFVDRSAPGVASATRNVRQLETVATGAAGRTRTAFLGAFPAFLTLGVLRQIGGAVRGLLAPVMDFDDAMADMRAFAHVTGDTIEHFGEQNQATFVAIARASRTAIPDVIRGFTELSKKGLEADVALAGTAGAAMLATVGHVELNKTLGAAFTLANTFGFGAVELGHRLDQMAVAANGSSLGFDDIADAVVRTTNGVVRAKPVFEDLLFVLAATRDSSVSTAMAGTQVRLAYERLSALKGVLAGALGVPTVELATGKVRQLSDVMFDASIKWKGTGRVMDEVTKLVGTKAAGAFAGLAVKINAAVKSSKNVEEARKAMFKFRDEIVNADGTLAELAKKQLEGNLRAQLQLLKVDAGLAAIAIGETLAPSVSSIVVVLDRVARAVTVVVNGFSKMGEASPALSAVGNALERIVFSLAIGLGVVAASRAAWALLGGAVGFSAMEMRGALVTQAGLTAELAEGMTLWELNAAAANAAAFGYTNAQRAGAAFGLAMAGVQAEAIGAATAVTFLGRATKFATMALGPVGLILGAIALAAPLFALFGNDADALVKAQKQSLRESDSQIARLRAAGDEAGAKFLESARIIKDVLGKKVEPLDAATLDKAAAVFQGLPQDIRSKFGIGFEKTLGESRMQFQNIVDQLGKTGVVDIDTRTAMQQSLEDLRTVFALAAKTDPRAEAVLKMIDAQLAGLIDVSQGAQDIAASMDRLAGGGRTEAAARQTENASIAAAEAVTASGPLLTGPRATVVSRGMETPITSDMRDALMKFADASAQQEQQRRNEEAATASSIIPAGPIAGTGGAAAKTGWETVAKKTDETNSILRGGILARIRADDFVDVQARANASTNARGNVVE